MRIFWIDGLKGLGALMVFFTHYRMMGLFYPFNDFFKENFLMRFFMSGNLAVCLFLLLSGYCIAYSVDFNWSKLQSLVLKRYFRIAVPISFLFLIEGFLYVFGIFGRPEAYLDPHPTILNPYSGLTLYGLVKAVFLSPIGIHCGWLSPAWMLKYIYIGTFVVLITKIAIQNLKRTRALAFIVLIALLLFSLSEYYIPVILGLLFYEARNDWSFIQRTKLLNNYLGLLLFVVLIFVHTYFVIPFGDIIESALIFVAVVLSGDLQRTFSSRLFKFLGKISFSVYLIHWPLICSFCLWLNRLLPYEGNSTICTFILFGCTLLILIILSAIWNKYIEGKFSTFLIKEILAFFNPNEVNPKRIGQSCR